MSKKLASGADAIVLDVKTGSGSFLTEYEDSLKLAKTMVEIGKSLGRKTVAIISNMAEPLGCAVGNINEVIEAIEVLKGNGPQDVHELCMVLGAEMLCLSEQADSTEEARERLEEAISSGAALDKLRQLVSQQGGDATMVDNIDRFEKPTESLELRSTEAGYITQLDARTVGESSMILGAGRETVDAVIDMTAGIYLYKKCGDHVNKGDVLAKLENRNAIKLQKAVDALKRAYLFSERKGNIPRLILHRID
jgi:pyrimidine-nucleoside phosphorylase